MCLHLWKRENSRKQKKKNKLINENEGKKTSHKDWMCIAQLSCFFTFLHFSRLYHLVRCAKHFRLMICNSCSLISYLGFSWVFPRKMAHCAAFECGNQAKTKQDPKRRFICFQKDNSLRRAWIHAVGKTSLPKICVCVRIIAGAIATLNHA